MKSGAFRHTIEVQTYSEIQDANFGTQKTWTTESTVFGKIQSVKGYVTLNAQQIGKGITHKITIRYYPYMNTEKWLYMDSRRFRIRSVRNLDERDRIMELLCEEDSFALNNFEVNIDAVGDPLSELLG